MTLQESFEEITDKRIDRCKKTQSGRHTDDRVFGNSKLSERNDTKKEVD